MHKAEKLGSEASEKTKEKRLFYQSYTFICFFLLVLLAYFLVPGKLRPALLLISSLLFYFSLSRSGLLWLTGSILTTYFAGRTVEQIRFGKGRRRKKKRKRAAAAVLAVCLLLNLGALALWKWKPAGMEGLLMPVGISFYTLQAAGYLIDVFRGKIEARRNLIDYALFVSFFPNIASGPIGRGGPFLEQVEVCKKRRLWSYESVTTGAVTMLWGYFLKMVLADRLAIVSAYAFDTSRLLMEENPSWQAAAGLKGGIYLLGIVFYTVQIYCDFASYSCLAAGCARIMGFSLQDNFKQPYLAGSMSEFWNRWHISLSSWLRDYIYFPLGGSRKGQIRKYCNTAVVFIASGVWHGTGVKYLIWGMLHAGYLIAEDLAKRSCRKRAFGRTGGPNAQVSHTEGGVPAPAAFGLKGVVLWCLQRVWVLLAAGFAWIFFRAQSVRHAIFYMAGLFSGMGTAAGIAEELKTVGMNAMELMILAAAFLIMTAVDAVSWRRKENFAFWMGRAPILVRFTVYLTLIVIILVFGMYGPGYQAQDFIYLQF